jgi:hypothetical protein
LKKIGFRNRKSISYSDFWPNFNKEDNFFTRALSGSRLKQTLTIQSVFPSVIKSVLTKGISQISPNSKIPGISTRNNVRRVWFTGENIRPPLDEKFNHYVSFDQDDYCGKNTYFPLFYAELLLPGKESINRRGLSIDNPVALTKPRKIHVKKERFVCAFVSNPEPTRMRALKELSRYGDVEIFGAHAGRPVDSKYEVARNFRFMLCFENDLFPGYVTEKLLDAYLCTTVPLYWGDFGREPHINRRALLNAAEYESLEVFSRTVGQLSEVDYERIYSQPLLSSLPSIQPFQRALLGS